MAAEAWKRTTVEQLVRAGALAINDGYRAKNLELGEPGVPFARAGNIDQGFDFSDADCLREEHLSRVGEKGSRPGDVVFTSKGTVGRLAFVRPETPRFVYSPQLCFWRVKEPRVLDSRFLFYWMRGEEFSRQVDAVKGQTDITDYVSLKEQRRMHLTLPPLAEQRAIAEILGTLDDRILVGQRLIHTLESMIQALFRYWFVDFEPVRARAAGQGPELPSPELAKLFPAALTAHGLPVGWSRNSLGGLLPGANCVLTGPFGSLLHASDYRAEGVPLIQVGDVNDGRVRGQGLLRVGAHKVPALERYRLREGDLVFTRVGAVGRSAHVPAHQAGWMISGQMLRVRLPTHGPLHPRYLAQVYRQDAFLSQVEGYALGTTRPSLNTALLEALPFLVPSRTVQDAFAARVAPLDQRVWKELDARVVFEALRDTLIPELLSGRRRVSEAQAAIAAHG
ncbi:restriction endonuclease subunit S [Hyalangium rubrum]|uniref:Restriction endonuclease subunit S n=1 Tax=Hyalangium rubrum TaxID=3103134 RepID=A0ABU5GZM5_9BACT|nr:restriction endonuclease subunit S [Hyalangium sp. s54d21]MDY7226486.1 restriction endonuclease subunit S [Hyalangium sp. s54d21]